jgi:hypothetical protein
MQQSRKGKVARRSHPQSALGAVHFFEVIYIFNNLRMRDVPWTDAGLAVADKMPSW